MCILVKKIIIAKSIIVNNLQINGIYLQPSLQVAKNTQLIRNVNFLLNAANTLLYVFFSKINKFPIK